MAKLSDFIKQGGSIHVPSSGMTETGFMACADCGGPMILFLHEIEQECPNCAWEGPVLAKSETDAWCMRCGHVWNLVHAVAMKEAN